MAEKKTFKEVMEKIAMRGSSQYVLDRLVQQARVTNVNKGWIEWIELNHASNRDLKFKFQFLCLKTTNFVF